MFFSPRPPSATSSSADSSSSKKNHKKSNDTGFYFNEQTKQLSFTPRNHQQQQQKQSDDEKNLFFTSSSASPMSRKIQFFYYQSNLAQDRAREESLRQKQQRREENQDFYVGGEMIEKSRKQIFHVLSVAKQHRDERLRQKELLKAKEQQELNDALSLHHQDTVSRSSKQSTSSPSSTPTESAQSNSRPQSSSNADNKKSILQHIDEQEKTEEAVEIEAFIPNRRANRRSVPSQNESQDHQQGQSQRREGETFAAFSDVDERQCEGFPSVFAFGDPFQQQAQSRQFGGGRSNLKVPSTERLKQTLQIEREEREKTESKVFGNLVRLPPVILSRKDNDDFDGNGESNSHSGAHQNHNQQTRRRSSLFGSNGMIAGRRRSSVFRSLKNEEGEFDQSALEAFTRKITKKTADILSEGIKKYCQKMDNLLFVTMAGVPLGKTKKNVQVGRIEKETCDAYDEEEDQEQNECENHDDDDDSENDQDGESSRMSFNERQLFYSRQVEGSRPWELMIGTQLPNYNALHPFSDIRVCDWQTTPKDLIKYFVQ